MSILSKFINANHHYNQAINYLEQKRYQQALSEFDRTLRLNPRYTLAFINRGKLNQQHLGRPRHAAADYKRALKLDPHDDQTRYRLAKLYQSTGKYQKSADHFKRVMLDAGWTKKAGAAAALANLNTEQYRSAAQKMHRILSKLDFH